MPVRSPFPRPRVGAVRARLRDEFESARILRGAGMLPRDPIAFVRGARFVVRLGPFGGLPGYCASVHDGVAVTDDREDLTYAEFASRTHRFAHAVRSALGDTLDDRPSIGILTRNHATALVALCGAAATGARVVLLGADSGPRQVEIVSRREGLDLLIHDEEFTTAARAFTGPRWLAWRDRTGDPPADSVDGRIADAPDTVPPRPPRHATLVILTSGTSGVPKGAPRGEPRTLTLTAGLLQRIPLRAGERILLSAPVFHGWGLLVAMLALCLGSTLVLHRRFDADRALETLERERCAVFIAVPTMIRRVLTRLDDVGTADLSALRIVASGGARLDPALVDRAATTLGSVLHNLYGSTEAAYISIATPDDLAVAPDCAGRPPVGNVVVIADDRGEAVPVDVEGRILVRTPGQIEAYTDGTPRRGLGAYLDTGDRGRLDGAGRLYVSGRSDSMIVSGGENVYPEELELALQAHPLVGDVAVTPVDDDEFGQRLRAYIVRAGRAAGSDPSDGDPSDSGCAAGGVLDEHAVRAHVAAVLPRSRMPRDIVFLDTLPRSAAGKVLRGTLDELKERHR